jgi:hypothetical protein
MMRMAVVAGLPDLFSSLRLETYKRTGFEISVDNRKPKELWFITQYYRPEKVKRAREIKKCLEMNIQCPVVDKIILLNETDLSKSFPADSSEKIKQGASISANNDDTIGDLIATAFYKDNYTSLVEIVFFFVPVKIHSCW